MSYKEENRRISFIFYGIIVCSIMLLATSCKSKTIFVPVESVKTEYRDRIQLDSIHAYDSIFVKMKNDTVWLEKYKYLYRNRLLRDSVYLTDSIQVPYPVIETKEVNRLTSLQSFQLWCGRILIGLLAIYLFYIFIRKKLK